MELRLIQKINENILKAVRSIKSRPDLLILFVVALIIRLGYLYLMASVLDEQGLCTLAPDGISYLNIGRGIAQGVWANEHGVVIFGPGYGVFLGLFFILFGQSAVPLLIFQGILSSLSCLMVYFFGKALTQDKMVGLLAGYLCALSFTSISLCNIFLSDCLFYFMFLWANLLFIRGLAKGRRVEFIVSGIVLGLTILVRSIGQFWPLAMIVLVYIWPSKNLWTPNRITILKRAIWAPGIALIIILVWSARNYNEHGLFMPAFTSAGGPANIALFTLERVTKRPANEIRGDWESEYLKKTGKSWIDYTDRKILNYEKVKQVVKTYPFEFIKTYLLLVWENLNEGNELFRAQLPQYCWQIIRYLYWLKDHIYFYYWVTILSLLSFIVLMCQRRWRILLVLFLFYGYFAAMIGFTHWQGSRLFYPGAIAWSVLLSILALEFMRMIRKVFLRGKIGK